METKNLGTSITIYACAVISFVLILSGSSAAMLSEFNYILYYQFYKSC